MWQLATMMSGSRSTTRQWAHKSLKCSEPGGEEQMAPLTRDDSPSAAEDRDAESTPRGSAVRLVQASKAYGGVLAVDRVTLDIKERELLTLLGPSGSGKTTVLRMIAGLVQPTSGEVWIGVEEVHRRPVHEREIAMVFQSLALFPHMDVFSNIAFPLRMRRLGRGEISDRVRDALDIVRLPDIGHRKVTELSGGQQQRVALARALVYRPKLLLLDEPLGSLDRRLREEMELEIVRLHREIDVTIVNVTHDQQEALRLSDRIGVMRLGRLEQVGFSEELYRNPKSGFVAEFLGDANLLDGRVQSDEAGVTVETGAGAILMVDDVEADAMEAQHCTVVLRAESIELHAIASDRTHWNRFAGIVGLRAFEGSATYYEVEVAELRTRLKVLAPEGTSATTFAVGDTVSLEWSPSGASVVSASPPAEVTGR